MNHVEITLGLYGVLATGLTLFFNREAYLAFDDVDEARRYAENRDNLAHVRAVQVAEYQALALAQREDIARLTCQRDTAQAEIETRRRKKSAEIAQGNRTRARRRRLPMDMPETKSTGREADHRTQLTG